MIIGNSGSGKDSIISGVINKYPSKYPKIYNPKRYITRPPSETEDNIPISVDEFMELDSKGKLALKWHIYGLYYGVPKKIDEFLEKEHPVIVNVSRTIIEKARKQYKNIKVVFVKVPYHITKERLLERGREREEELQKRLARAKKNQEYHDANFIVDNSGDLDDAINQLLNYITKIVKK